MHAQVYAYLCSNKTIILFERVCFGLMRFWIVAGGNIRDMYSDMRVAYMHVCVRASNPVCVCVWTINVITRKLARSFVISHKPVYTVIMAAHPNSQVITLH